MCACVLFFFAGGKGGGEGVTSLDPPSHQGAAGWSDRIIIILPLVVKLVHPAWFSDISGNFFFSDQVELGSAQLDKKTILVEAATVVIPCYSKISCKTLRQKLFSSEGGGQRGKESRYGSRADGKLEVSRLTGS